MGQLTTSNGIVQVLRAGDVIETPQGVPMTLELKSSGARVDMDGSAALKVSRSGEETIVEILRGRVIVGAGTKPQVVECGESSIAIDAHSVAAIDFDTPFRRIVGQGAVVELQRQTISDVARDAERLYGGRIETSALPERVAKRRISLYGVGLRRDEFLDAFKSAVERYGVAFKAEGKNLSLSYTGTAGNTADESESVLKVAPLSGSLLHTQEGESRRLSESLSQAIVVEDSTVTNLESAAGAMKAQRMVVWAGRTDMPYFKLDATVSNYITDASRNGGKVVVASALPVGTVLTEGGLRFKSGALIKIGEQVEIALPGAKGGKLLGVMSSGIEVAKGDDANTRYFVPVSAGR